MWQSKLAFEIIKIGPVRDKKFAGVPQIFVQIIRKPFALI